MIEINKAVFPSPEQWIAVVHGMRNPKNSWGKTDSKIILEDVCTQEGEYRVLIPKFQFLLGKNDLKLMRNLSSATGPEHAKFLRQLPVILDIKAPLYWWKQMDQYKVGTVTDSCSTMHKLTEKPFEVSDFSLDNIKEIKEKDAKDYLIGKEDEFGNRWLPGCWYDEEEITFEEFIKEQVIGLLNALRHAYLKTKFKEYWYALNEMLPQSYIQKRTWSANYEVLRTICRQRKGHKLSEWKEFIDWIHDNVPYAKELIFNEWDD